MARKKKEEITIENVETIENLEKEINLEVTEETLSKKYRVIAKSGLRVRQEPSLTSMILDILKVGTIVEGSEKNDFVEINCGYLYKKYLEELKEERSGN